MSEIIKFGEKTPKIDASAKLFSGCKIIGDVQLEKNVNIWFNAVLRGDTKNIFVGENTNIQDNAVLHGDHDHPIHIGANVTVGHSAIIHGAHVEEGALIGMGAILLNGVRVGSNCLVAAGAVCPPGAVYEPNSLIVGNPGKAIKTMHASQIEQMHQNTAYYVTLSKSY